MEYSISIINFCQMTWVAQKAYIACKHAPLTNIQQNTKKNNYTIQEQAISTQKNPFNKEKYLVEQKTAKCQPERNWFSYL